MYYAAAKEMEMLDRLAVENGLEIRQMMELAGWHMLAVFRRMKIKQDARVAVVVGVGNKGGDGLSAARHLSNHGHQVTTILISERISRDALHHLELLEKMGVQVVMFSNLDRARTAIQGADIIIDALIGYHLDGAPRGDFIVAIEAINASQAMVIAYDLPTGMDPDTGTCMDLCIKADATLTLALPKKLFKEMNGRERAGMVFLGDIGIPPFLYDKLSPNSRPTFSESNDGLIKI